MAAEATEPDDPAVASPGAAGTPAQGPRGEAAAEAGLVDSATVETAAELVDAVEQSRRLAWQVAVDAAGVGTFDWDIATRTLVWDERFATLFGYEPQAGLREGTQDFPRRVHPQDLPEVNAAIAAAITERKPYAAEFRVVLPDGRVRWVACRGRVLADQSGQAVRMLGAAYDITLTRAAQEQAERATGRAELLAQVTMELTETLDADRGVARLVNVLVPELADWCIVSLVPDDLVPDTGPGATDAPQGYRLQDVGWAHIDPEAAPILGRYVQTRTKVLTEEHAVARALRNGRLTQVSADAARVLQASLAPGPARDMIGQLAPETALWMPLRARGRTVGLISLYRGPRRGPFPAPDVDTVRDIAGRAGLALDNTRLYQQQRRLAEELQRAMLTGPPQLEHLQFAVRYVPASDAAQVGGDWYDAFVQPDGAVTVVIGDVVGHDVVAAAAMGQLRSMLRTIAAYSGAGPAEVLHGLDTTMTILEVPLTATATVARIDQTRTDRARGTARLRWSAAGHLPAVLLHPDGSTTELSHPDPDLLLGLDPTLPRTETVRTMIPGDILLLYTDGLIERRDQALDEGIARLHQTLTTLASPTVTLEQLCDDLLVRLLPTQPEDDVALIAVRLRRPPPNSSAQPGRT